MRNAVGEVNSGFRSKQSGGLPFHATGQAIFMAWRFVEGPPAIGSADWLWAIRRGRALRRLATREQRSTLRAA